MNGRHPGAGKLEWLEVLRGAAALWVLLHHAALTTDAFIGIDWGNPFLRNGNLGVDFFFVLSGFIIAFSGRRMLLENRGAAAYFSARLVRVYVPYLPVGIAVLLAYHAFPTLSQGGRSLSVLTSVTLLPAQDPPALSVAWTLVHEIIFYGVFGLVFVSRRLFGAVAVLWGLLICWSALVWNAPIPRPMSYVLSPLNLYFLLGVAVFWVSARVRLRHAGFLLAGALLFVVAVSSMAQVSRWWVGGGFAVAVLAASQLSSLPRLPLSFERVLLILGTASYSVYLVHNPFQSLVVRLLRSIGLAESAWMGFWVIAMASLAAGLAYWYLIERPLLPVVRRFVQRRFHSRPSTSVHAT